jgi:CDP-glucose 4,6-dehydratase
MNIKKFFNKKTVIITGHTGFKGSWLTLWLYLAGAKIIGLSIDEPSKPSHFNSLNLKNKIKNIKIDVRNLSKLKKIFKKYQPDFVFHLAAQSIVKKSYINPIFTYETNAIGTLNVLESLRSLKRKCTALFITSDKTYKNFERKTGYKEDEILGGNDLYSSSKASADILINSYVKSFFFKKKNITIGVARAGNVIGGGDWSEYRLIPDCIKAWSKKKKVIIRNPSSTRPWQHVLEIIWGYILFSIKLKNNRKIHGTILNFGPNQRNNYTVLSVIKIMKQKWRNIKWKVKKEKNSFHESHLLSLNSNKSLKLLKWNTLLNLKQTIYLVIEWYKSYYFDKKNIYELSVNQIKFYEKLIKKKY